MIDLRLGDCLEIIPGITDKSVDMILCDLPYGTTACKWDTIIPFEPLWEQYKRIIKDNGAIVLTASQPFTSILVMSNIKMFKYEWIWEKNVASNFMQYKFMPAKKHENILVFAKGRTTYNAVMEDKSPSSLERMKYKFKNRKQSEHYKTDISKDISNRKEKMYPTSIKKFNRETGLHPTQKPVALFEYLIKTYSNEGDLVLDNCMGSGTTGLACKNLKRNFIGIEKDENYYKIAERRINNTVENLL
ncbi:MAG: site-specific DNA-methyltransferase [Candidatus Izemoplasmatales bacterium]